MIFTNHFVVQQSVWWVFVCVIVFLDNNFWIYWPTFNLDIWLAGLPRHYPGQIRMSVS